VNAALWVTAVRICTIPVVMALVLVFRPYGLFMRQQPRKI